MHAVNLYSVPTISYMVPGATARSEFQSTETKVILKDGQVWAKTPNKQHKSKLVAGFYPGNFNNSVSHSSVRVT